MSARWVIQDESGAEYGPYAGATREAAREAMAQDAGYDSFREQCEDTGNPGALSFYECHCDACQTARLTVEWETDDGPECQQADASDLEQLARDVDSEAPEGPPRPIVANCGAVVGWVWRGQVAA